MRPASVDASGGDGHSNAPALIETLQAFDCGGLHWCLLRDADDLPTAGGEVDVLLAPPDLAAAERVLARAGFTAMRAWGRTPHRFFVRAGAAGTLKLDIVTALAFGRWGELRTEAAATGLVLARRRRSGLLSVPALDDAFWALLLHVLLDRKQVDLSRTAQLGELARDAGGESVLAHLVDAAAPRGWDAERVRAAAAEGKLPALAPIVPALRREWPIGSTAGRRRHVLAGRVLRRLDRRLPGHGGRRRGAQTSGLITSNSRLSSTG